MNAAVSDKLNIVLKHAQPSIQSELSQHLAACGFTDFDDPALNALVAQSIIAGQPVRLVESGGAALATEAGMARLGDRIENTAWSLARLRIGIVVLACLASFGLGAGGVALAFKLRGASLARYFDLPAAADTRLGTLGEMGATLRVEQKKGSVYVYFDGQIQPAAGRSKSGLNFLYFTP